MAKTYSGERVPGTLRYNLKVKEGSIEHCFLVPEPSIQIPMEGFGPDESANRLALAILLDFTKNPQTSFSHYKDFNFFLAGLFLEDNWMLHSSRIELFFKLLEETPQFSKPLVSSKH
ncbi:hypothetical protein EHQ68_03410 [Leptospira congkakensis]|uniref:Uncharacterized protein n=1 Tax=Leptospira congkakensis TaxID=2484932 RepID=A0A4Z1AD81_9LEPT|nr:hypothetical protein [Leptospira congkakensis]TGL90493.1 hypothetical protein EHQ69_11170 [Leptospira congkakensis]TGL91500.1 hypothetical protein EHQ68_03410 [Leptospira congkakensis]TGL98553.1 hypothetical protein EHQ70_02995 [Leptospira congkakensis]